MRFFTGQMLFLLPSEYSEHSIGQIVKCYVCVHHPFVHLSCFCHSQKLLIEVQYVLHYIALLCLVPGLQQPGPALQYKCQR